MPRSLYRSEIDVVAFRNHEYRPKLLAAANPPSDKQLVARIELQCISKRKSKTKPPEYGIWAGMVARCRPGSGHKDYAGRGITVCAEWRASFDAFFTHVGCRPSALYSIGRLDNDGDYEPGNVAWQTPEEQQNNRRNTLWIPYRGKIISATQFSRITGIPYKIAIRFAWTQNPARPERTHREPAFEKFDYPIFEKVSLHLEDTDCLAYRPCDSFEISMDAVYA